MKQLFQSFFLAGSLMSIHSQALCQPTYRTGTSAGDNKLKAFEKKIEALEKSLAEFKAFLESDEVYDFKTHYFIQIEGEGDAMRLRHRTIERDILLPLDDLEKGKMYAKDYPFTKEKSIHDDYASRYNSLVASSNARALGHAASKETVMYESSIEYKLKQERNKTMYAPKPEEDFSSAFHKQHIGQIVFGGQQIEKTSIGEKTLATFKTTDHIYARAYFAKGLHNSVMYDEKGDSTGYMPYQDVLVYTNVYVDGVKQSLKIEQDASDDPVLCQARTRQLWLHPFESDGLTEINWIKILADVPLGNHEIKLEYCAYNFDDTGESKSTYTAVLATGSFTLVKQSNELPKIGKKWSDLKRGTSQPSLESKALAIAQKNSNIDQMKSEEIKILDSDWRIVKNELTGAILYRYMRVLLKASHPDGYCYSTPMEIKQEYSGNGNYSTNLLLVGLAAPDFGFDGYLDCE